MKKKRLDYLLKLVKENKQPTWKINYEICLGLSEVCDMFAESQETSMYQKEQFVKYSNVFKKFAKIHKNKTEKEVNEDMVKRLTNQEREDREIRVILAKIRKLEKSHSQHLVEKSCSRYKNANLDKRKAEKEMKELEKKLADAKRRLR